MGLKSTRRKTIAALTSARDRDSEVVGSHGGRRTREVENYDRYVRHGRTYLCHYRAQDAAGENERNGAKEADATGSMHSSCARRRGLRHHRRSRRCRRRVATELSDLWRNGYEPLSSTSGFSRQFAASLTPRVVDEFYTGLLLTSEHPVQRARDLSRRRAVRERRVVDDVICAPA
ncbi:hypothetical protein ALC62_07097 [Cyphomyrmex costatus]|uniref:Uncharacterized protein n=1 Tax=Cyphomyrmex costatus TaxID=456900 RepID=A0A195CNQ4_9HYME|nr:hypothetical protein ALC62_07097 [Cyphomyrmex costatus]